MLNVVDPVGQRWLGQIPGRNSLKLLVNDVRITATCSRQKTHTQPKPFAPNSVQSDSRTFLVIGIVLFVKSVESDGRDLRSGADSRDLSSQVVLLLTRKRRVRDDWSVQATSQILSNFPSNRDLLRSDWRELGPWLAGCKKGLELFFSQKNFNSSWAYEHCRHSRHICWLQFP